MKEWLETILKAVPFIQAYPLWVQLLAVTCVLVFAVLVATLIVVKPDGISPNPTGDVVIDRVLVRLAKLPRPLQDSALSDTLLPLFDRPAFYPDHPQGNEGDWRHFLYALCRTRRLLEDNKNEFRSLKIQSAISQAAQRMYSLEIRTAALYGPGFSLSAHIKQFIGNSEKFIDSLPKMVLEPDQDFEKVRKAEISQIRTILSDVGLVPR